MSEKLLIFALIFAMLPSLLVGSGIFSLVLHIKDRQGKERARRWEENMQTLVTQQKQLQDVEP